MTGIYQDGTSSSFTVYPYGEIVMMSEPVPQYSLYIKWTPSTLSEGSFAVGTSIFYFSDFSGMITDLDGLTVGNLLYFSNNKVTTVETNYPNYITFSNCSLLTQATKYSYIGSEVKFTNCSALRSVSIPDQGHIGTSCFSNCTSLSQISLPVCKSIGNSAFSNCTSLSQISLPVCSVIYTEAFRNCTALSRVYAPSCVSIYRGAFSSCTTLKSISLPACESIGRGCFWECSSLSSIVLPNCSFLDEFAFCKCTTLSKITLGYSSVCTLNYDPGAGDISPQTFILTPIWYGSGSIYVPSSLVSAYKSAQYWSEYASLIYPINN